MFLCLSLHECISMCDFSSLCKRLQLQPLPFLKLAVLPRSRPRSPSPPPAALRPSHGRDPLCPLGTFSWIKLCPVTFPACYRSRRNWAGGSRGEIPYTCSAFERLLGSRGPVFKGPPWGLPPPPPPVFIGVCFFPSLPPGFVLLDWWSNTSFNISLPLA